ncbi:MAG TPA: YezD family protein [Verrucomicrobiae bacterium]|nr:YezD family protein [Verrucomicrobiae bacterium]
MEALKKIKFGSVEVIVHEGQVVQIESKEKVRFSHAR